MIAVLSNFFPEVDRNHGIFDRHQPTDFVRFSSAGVVLDPVWRMTGKEQLTRIWRTRDRDVAVISDAEPVRTHPLALKAQFPRLFGTIFRLSKFKSVRTSALVSAWHELDLDNVVFTEQGNS